MTKRPVLFDYCRRLVWSVQVTFGIHECDLFHCCQMGGSCSEKSSTTPPNSKCNATRFSLLPDDGNAYLINALNSPNSGEQKCIGR
jgi:hypothetical protein